MAAEYVVLLVFALFSLLMPASLLLGSRLMRRENGPNPVSTLSFESGEESIGSRMSIMGEYFHYFSSFLAFEVIVAIVLIWAAVARLLPYIINVYVLLFLAFAFVLEVYVLVLAKDRGHDE